MFRDVALRFAVPLALILSTIAPFRAHAALYCVNNTTELFEKLEAAAASAEDDSVRVRSGTFSITGEISFLINGALTFSGGWSASCLVQSANPGASTITSATPGQRGISLRPRDGDLVVERLTFDRLDSVVLRDLGNSASATGEIRLARSRFIDNNIGPTVRTRDKNVRIENNIITGSQGGSFHFDRSLATAPFVADIHNNTLVGGSEGMRITGTPGTVRVRNNVMDGDYNAGIVIDDGVVTVNHNALDGGFTYLMGGSASPSFDNDLVIDPLFDAAFVPQTGSALINSGTNSIAGGAPSTDYAGGQRRIGSRIDRGARESLISDLDTLTVTNTANSGAGSLRQAVLDANVTANEETIAFNIAGSCPRVISLATALPTISNTLTIDGFTQPGSSANTEEQFDDSMQCIVLSSDAATALNLTPGPEQEITVRGLAFYAATLASIQVSGSGSATIVGNTFNTGTTVFEPDVPQYAISVDQATGTRIGGNAPADRNIIGRASVAGVRLGPGYGRHVVGNFIGITKDGNGDAGNAIGVLVIDGEADTLSDNAIGSNASHGVRVEGANSEMNMQRNLIGPSPNPNLGAFASANGGNAIRLIAGGPFFLRNNVIAFHPGDGIAVLAEVRGADLSVNKYYNNEGLAIDLSPDGVDLIDNDTTGSGGNGGQNYPVLVTARGNDFSGSVSGSLASANGSYEITLYRNGSCNASDHGEGRTLVGGGQVSIDNGIGAGDGQRPFNIAIASDNGLANTTITALATRRGNPGDGNTSEFSRCLDYQATDVFADGFEDP